MRWKIVCGCCGRACGEPTLSHPEAAQGLALLSRSLLARGVPDDLLGLLRIVPASWVYEGGDWGPASPQLECLNGG